MEIVTTLAYERLQRIGQGEGMNSEVFLARHEQFGGNLVVKEIPKARLGNSVVAYFGEAKALFQSEHPNVVRVHYCSETPDLVCIAMPYYANGSLTPRIADRPLALREVIRVGVGVLEGLSQVHTAGFVHLDVKPSNVLFSDADSPLVADFGQSRSIGPDGTAEVPRMYLSHVPPEVLSGGRTLPQSDIYQAALTLYRAANGAPHFARQVPADATTLQQRVLAGKFPDRGSFLPHVPRSLATVIRRGLEVDPADRFGTAREFADALGRVTIVTEWNMEALPDGSLKWTGSRDGRGPVQVALSRGQARKRNWDVSVATTGSGRLQRKRDLCKADLLETAAWRHLKDVFRQLR